MTRLRKHKRDDSLIGQVVAANVVLVTLTLVAGSLVAGLDLSVHGQRWQLLVLVLVLVLTFCVNLWMLQRRFGPLEHLIELIEEIDPADPGSLQIGSDRVEEIDRLGRSFNRLLERVDHERSRSGQLVLRAQEEERGRVARDLHDEVNQALTAVLLRLEALGQDVPPAQRGDVDEIKRLALQAMDELVNLARQLRPAALDDHGLVTAIEAQVRGFGERTGVQTHLETSGDPTTLDDDKQTVIYRIAQEALLNAGRHASASHVDVALAADADGASLRVSDDGTGFDPATARAGGLGLEGMAERARLVGGHLDLRSSPGAGTELTLRVP
jgi:two-component system sensor histidine kinase UhpB